MKVSILKKEVNTKTLNFVLLSIATLGIYNLMWLFKNNSKFEEVLEQKIFDYRLIILLSAIVGWSSVFSSEPDLEIIGGLLSLASSVFYIVWAFKAKKVIQTSMVNEYKIDYKMNSFYTFFFNMYYINYCVNELEDEVNKANILSEKVVA